MVARRDVSALEAFTGAIGIQARAFDTKVNTFAGHEADGYSPTQYIPPAPLTDADVASIRTHAGHILDQLYGPLEAAG